MTSFIRYTILTVGILFVDAFRHPSIAQVTFGRSSEDSFNKGVSLFEQAEYAAAQACFETVLEGDNYKQEEVCYYLMLLALINKDPHVEIMLQHFIVRYPQSPSIEKVRYRLAHFFYQAGDFHKSRFLYEKIQPH